MTLKGPFSDLVLTLTGVGSAAVIGLAVEEHVTTADLLMLFLLALIIIAFRTSMWPALAAVAIAVATFDFLFVPPRLRFSVQDGHFILTFGAMAIVGLTVTALSDRVRRQSEQLTALGVEREKERFRTALLSSVSHDLRTPLGVIVSAVTSLLDTHATLPADRREELLRTIESQTNNLGRLLRNLLEMTRLDGMSEGPQLEPNAIEEVVETALRGLGPDASQRVETVRTPECALFARMDPIAIEIVVSNLLENAVKYSPATSPISVRIDVGSDTRSVVVEVEDRGPGVAIQDRQRIFEKFARGAHPGIPGAGLGLAISRAIVEAHGGDMYCRDTPSGIGVAFGFTLPRADEVEIDQEADHE